MAAITQIKVRIVTGNRPGAGTDGEVYVAVCGREFDVDSAANDFERASDRTYTFGVGADVLNPADNDPRTPFQLDTADVGRFPRWVRFEPGGLGPDWDLEQVTVT